MPREFHCVSVTAIRAVITGTEDAGVHKAGGAITAMKEAAGFITSHRVIIIMTAAGEKVRHRVIGMAVRLREDGMKVHLQAVGNLKSC